MAGSSSLSSRSVNRDAVIDPDYGDLNVGFNEESV